MIAQMKTDFESNHIATANNMGYMTKKLDAFCEEFIAFTNGLKKPVADLGVAYGYTTQKILSNGATVYANDLSEEHLSVLADNISEKERKRLFLFPGKLPDIFKFSENSLGGVLAARCLHFLRGEEIEELIEKVYRALDKGGCFCIVAETPYLRHLQSFIPEYELKKHRKELWPGYIEDLKKYTNRPHSAEWVNLLDPEILTRCFKKVGLKIQKVSFIDRPYFPKEVRFDGRESVGIIGVK